MEENQYISIYPIGLSETYQPMRTKFIYRYKNIGALQTLFTNGGLSDPLLTGKRCKHILMTMCCVIHLNTFEKILLNISISNDNVYPL